MIVSNSTSPGSLRRGLVLGACVAVGVLLLAAPALSAPPLLNWWGDPGDGDGQIGASAPGIAVDGQGDVFIADLQANRVKRFSNSGQPLGAWGGVDQPSGVAVAPDGTIYVSDRVRVGRYTRTGEPVAEWKSGARFDEAPPAETPGGPNPGTPPPTGTGGIAVAPNGTVFVTDLGKGQIRRFDPTGAELEAWSGLREPRGVAVAPAGDVYVADDGNNQIRRYSPTGSELGAWQVDDPNGVAVAPDGQVYVAEARANRVLRFNPEGVLQESFGDTGEGGARLVQPLGVAADCQGTVYVLDSSEKRVHTFGDPAAKPPPCDLAPHEPEREPTPTPTPTPTPGPGLKQTPTPTPNPEPKLGATTLAEVVQGKVLIDTGTGRREPLTGSTLVPIGATVDATRGRARLTFETGPDGRAKYGQYQSGEFYGGEFTVHQARGGNLVELRLAGAKGSRVLKSRASASKRRRKRSVRRLWGNAQGQFRTTGRYAAATVRGTRWLTEDSSLGTLVKVHEGVVAVDELERRGRTLVLGPGDKHLTRPRCASRRNFKIRLRAPVGAKVRSARVLVNGKRARVWRGSRPRARVDLRGLPKGRVTVRIKLRTDTGVTLRGTRTYQTCAKGRAGGVPRL